MLLAFTVIEWGTLFTMFSGSLVLPAITLILTSREKEAKLRRDEHVVAKLDDAVEARTKQGEVLAKVALQSDGLLEKVGDIREKQGKLIGADEQRKRQAEIDAAVIVATNQQTSAQPVPVVVENVKPVKVTETKKGGE